MIIEMDANRVYDTVKYSNVHDSPFGDLIDDGKKLLKENHYLFINYTQNTNKLYDKIDLQYILWNQIYNSCNHS